MAPDGGSADPEVIKLNAIVDLYSGIAVDQLCGRFDHYLLRVPNEWRDGFGVDTWVAACGIAELRRQIDVMISNSRHRKR